MAGDRSPQRLGYIEQATGPGIDVVVCIWRYCGKPTRPALLDRAVVKPGEGEQRRIGWLMLVRLVRALGRDIFGSGWAGAQDLATG